MAQAATPTVEDVRSQIVRERGEEWLAQKLTELDQQYAGAIKDDFLRHWLVAQNNGIEVGEIKMDGGQEGRPIKAIEVTRDFVRQQMNEDQKAREYLAAEGTVLNIRFGKSQNDKDKVTFTLIDETGAVTVTAWGDAMGLFVNSRVKEGDYIRMPLLGVFGFQPDDKGPDGYYRTLSLPPFGAIQKLDRDGDVMFKDPDMDAVTEGSPVLVQGIIPKLEQRKNKICSTCRQWVMEKKPEAHARCGQFTTTEEVHYEASLATGSGQYYTLKFHSSQGKPEITPSQDLLKVYGFFGKRNINVARYVITVKGGGGGTPSKTAGPKASAPRTPTPTNTTPTTTQPAQAAPVAQPSPPSPPQPAAAAQVAVNAAAPATNGLVPAAVLEHFKRTVQPFGTNRVLLVVNAGVTGNVVSGATDEEKRELLKEYLAQAISEGYLAFADENQKTVSWTGA